VYTLRADAQLSNPSRAASHALPIDVKMATAAAKDKP